MLKKIRIIVSFIAILALLTTAIIYGTLTVSLPSLSGKAKSSSVLAPMTLERDQLGTAVITAKNRQDAAFGLGYAHGQDRFFQMDLLRRNATGELAEIFGEAAIPLDKKHRFHQFRKRAEQVLSQLPMEKQLVLQAYSQGVNQALSQAEYPSFEYILTGSTPEAWLAVDSLLVIYTMYLDLQTNTFKRDLVLSQIEKEFGKDMLVFLTQPSQYQVPLDDSQLPDLEIAIPKLSKQNLIDVSYQSIKEPLEVGSNNWAVTGSLTKSGHGMLSDDMHLSLRVPVIWYRTQLNYEHNNSHKQITGVSLPGAPAVVVGSNGHIAWGFTNGYLDTADWYKLSQSDKTTIVTEKINLPEGSDKSFVEYPLEMSPYGPVKEIDGVKYALTWVAHQDYAVNMELLNLELATNVTQALEMATSVGIPVQNMLVVDKAGAAAWKPTGAVPGRLYPTQVAVQSELYSDLWSQSELDLPQVLNPQNNRLWTANSRVVSVEDLERFGNGAYAMGARAKQIKDRLFAQDTFTESDFYQIQLDNQALFLEPWHKLLIKVLTTAKQGDYAQDLAILKNWKACACADSVGYTLVRNFRSALIDEVFAPLETKLKQHKLSLGPVKRDLEPAIWQLINQFPDSWLTEKHHSWPELMLSAYRNRRGDLLEKYSAGSGDSLQSLAWGKVNAFKLQHPFSKQMPFLSKLLDMPTVPGFGDSYMPAVQKTGFGASQRFFVQPGLEENAILTIPGGQSGHPLSPFYRSGFSDYIEKKNTPLLPTEAIHRIEFTPVK